MTHPGAFQKTLCNFSHYFLTVRTSLESVLWAWAWATAGGSVDTGFHQHPAEGKGLSQEPGVESSSPNLTKVLT